RFMVTPRQSSAVIFIEAGGFGSGPGRRPARRFRQPTTCMEPLGRAPEPRRSHTARRGFAWSLVHERSPLSPAAIGPPFFGEFALYRAGGRRARYPGSGDKLLWTNFSSGWASERRRRALERKRSNPVAIRLRRSSSVF